MNIWVIILVLVIACAIVHRNVITALIKGTPMPKAPKWHVWVPAEKRREQ
ncbi:MAG: hypothetical protein IJ120_01055 [Solobacterium sp.]|nr:hypothetical protein [Solobacterium sp.]